MPVVRTTGLNLPTGPFKLRIKCSADGEFTADFPPEISRVLGKKYAKGKSLQLCETDFYAGVADFKTAQTRKRKVIAYRVATTHKLSFSYGLVLCIQAIVAEETRIELEDAETRLEYQRVESSLPSEMQANGECYGGELLRYGHKPENVMDWTQEREDFFRRVAESTQAVIATLKQLQNTDKAIEIADSGTLLMGPTALVPALVDRYIPDPATCKHSYQRDTILGGYVCKFCKATKPRL